MPKWKFTKTTANIYKLNGIWTLLFLGRMSMVYGWIELIRSGLKRSNDFVSVDAQRLSAAPLDFEMVTPRPTYTPKGPDSRITSVASYDETDTIMEMSPSSRKELYPDEKAYITPNLSFSAPRPPSAGRRHSNSSRAPSIGGIDGLPSRQSSLVRPQGIEWDASATYAKPLKSPIRSNSGFSKI